MQPKVVYIAADHRGHALAEHLAERFGFANLITAEPSPDDDFNDAADLLSDKILQDPNDTAGIIVCGGGHGVCIAANRHRGIRAITAETPASVRLGREHNNANVLCLAADLTAGWQAEELIKTFLATPFDAAERRLRRIAKLDRQEEN